jgi:hypothetical protein
LQGRFLRVLRARSREEPANPERGSLTLLLLTRAPFTAVFYAIGHFSLSVIDMGWLTQLSVHVFMQAVASDVVDAVVGCLSALIEVIPDPHAFARGAQGPLIKAAVASIVDGFHKSVLVKLIELLRSIIELLPTAPGHQPFAPKGMLLGASTRRPSCRGWGSLKSSSDLYWTPDILTECQFL